MPTPSPAPDRPCADDETVGRLSVAIGRLNRRLRQEGIAADEMTLSQLSAMASVDRLGSLTLGELAAEERVKPPTMTRIVDRLEVDGYVRRVPDPSDRRCVRVELSDAGRSLLAGTRSRRDAFLVERVERLDPEGEARIPELVALLERLLEDDGS
ncbi:MAG TPA: MarR family transcriptional regulator [Acidimicrobiales bacterium]|jgi:DNA-binding MarR family transcriptional regulator